MQLGSLNFLFFFFLSNLIIIEKTQKKSFQLLSASLERRRRVKSINQVTPKLNLYFEVFTFRVIWITQFTLLLLSIEADNNWHDLCVSFQIISSSIERRRRVNWVIQITRKLNPYFEIFPFRVTWIIELTLLVLSNEADNNWNDSFVSFQVLSASIERRRRVNSVIQVTRKVNTWK